MPLCSSCPRCRRRRPLRRRRGPKIPQRPSARSSSMRRFERFRRSRTFGLARSSKSGRCVRAQSATKSLHCSLLTAHRWPSASQTAGSTLAVNRRPTRLWRRRHSFEGAFRATKAARLRRRNSATSSRPRAAISIREEARRPLIHPNHNSSTSSPLQPPLPRCALDGMRVMAFFIRWAHTVMAAPLPRCSRSLFQRSKDRPPNPSCPDEGCAKGEQSTRQAGTANPEAQGRKAPLPLKRESAALKHTTQTSDSQTSDTLVSRRHTTPIILCTLSIRANTMHACSWVAAGPRGTTDRVSIRGKPKPPPFLGCVSSPLIIFNNLYDN